MLFSSPTFVYLFLPLTLVIYLYLLKHRSLNSLIHFICFASLIFYGWREPKYLLLLIPLALMNFWLGNYFRTLRAQGKPVGPTLALGVALNLGPLFVFKYLDFAVRTTNDLTGANWPLLQLGLPLAISFFTFQKIAYLVDCAKTEVPRYTFREYLLFISFFPQLIAGPIIHHHQIIPQFQALRKSVDKELVLMGFTIFFFGLLKKVGLADPMGEYADLIFNQLGMNRVQTVGESWMGAIAYSLQIYFDFSGYSDMATGLALMFQVKMILNFASPYQSTSIVEFWRRWHISLSDFLRDYLYIPLGGNRHGRFRTSLNLILTMLLGGLWHGAGWTFVAWGLLHGIFLALNKAWNEILPPKGTPWWPVRESKKILVFLLVTVIWVFFRAENFSHATEQIRSMFGAGLATLPRGLEPYLSWLKGISFTGITQHQNKINNIDLVKIAGVLAIALYGPNLQSVVSRYRLSVFPADAKRLPSNTWGISWAPNLPWALLTAAVALAGSWLLFSGEKAFIYFKF